MLYRPQIASGFTILLGDRFDSVISIAILEHWSNVFAGLAHWNRVDYFHPYPDTLGYNDGLLLYGVPYAIFRRAGADPFLAAELTGVAVRATGFIGTYIFMRQALRVPWPVAVLAATVFTLSCSMATRADHIQLLSVAFVPLFGWLSWAAVTAFARTAWSRTPAWAAIAWAAAAALLMGAWLLTAFYMAWFTLFFTALVALLAIAPRPRATLATIKALPRQAWFALAAIAAIALAAISPFLFVYLPTAHATGGHSFFEVAYYSTRPLDLILIGDGNPLLSRMDAALQHAIRPRFQRTGEHVAGLTWVLLATFAAACLHLWRTRTDPALRPIRLLAIVTMLIWVLTLRIGATPLWWIVWATIPGAKGLRVIVRYQLFMAAPVIAVAIWYLARTRVPTAAVIGLAALLVAEQTTTAQPLRLDRRAERTELAAIPPPPPACRSFAITRARPGAVLSPEIDAIYSHNVEAMLLAELLHIPTINGFATFTPPGADLTHPDRPDYLDRIRAYAATHHLQGLCTLDLVDKRWAFLQSAPGQE